QLGDKGAKPVYVRDEADGSYLTDEHGNRMLYADFDRIIDEIRHSDATRRFRWMGGGPAPGPGPGWSVPIGRVLAEPTLCLDQRESARRPQPCEGNSQHSRTIALATWSSSSRRLALNGRRAANIVTSSWQISQPAAFAGHRCADGNCPI